MRAKQLWRRGMSIRSLSDQDLIDRIDFYEITYGDLFLCCLTSGLDNESYYLDLLAELEFRTTPEKERR